METVRTLENPSNQVTQVLTMFIWSVASQATMMIIVTDSSIACGTSFLATNHLMDYLAVMLQESKETLRKTSELDGTATVFRILVRVRSICRLLFETNEFPAFLFLLQSYLTAPVMGSLLYTLIYIDSNIIIQIAIFVQFLCITGWIFFMQTNGARVFSSIRKLHYRYSSLFLTLMNIMNRDDRKVLSIIIQDLGSNVNPHALSLGSKGIITSSYVFDNVMGSIVFFLMICSFVNGL
jgi:hypothetical protein